MSLEILKEKLKKIDLETKKVEKSISRKISEIPLKENTGHFEKKFLEEETLRETKKNSVVRKP